jgi:hypothetical protein
MSATSAAAHSKMPRTRLKTARPLATVLGRLRKEVGAVAGRSLSSDDDVSMRGERARLIPAWSSSELLQKGEREGSRREG